MTDFERFLAAIIESPEDDLPRLVFADWLEERGDTRRAEFIRLQCALDQEPHGTEYRIRSEFRCQELLKRDRSKWIINGIPGRQEFRRGFVEYLHLSADAFLVLANRIARETPLMALRLSVAADRTSQIIKIPLLTRLRELEIRNDGIGPRIREWFQPGIFPNLRVLSLRNNRLWSDSVETLAQVAIFIPHLNRLDLSGNPFGDEGAEHLAHANGLTDLRELILRSDDIDDEYSVHSQGLAAIAQSQELTKLESLNLAGQSVGDEGFICLANSRYLHSLAQIDLSRNEIGDRDSSWADELIHSENFMKLRYLNLSRNTIRESAAEILSTWRVLLSGCQVDLRGCRMTPDACRIIESSIFRKQFLLDQDAV